MRNNRGNPPGEILATASGQEPITWGDGSCSVDLTVYVEGGQIKCIRKVAIVLPNGKIERHEEKSAPKDIGKLVHFFGRGEVAMALYDKMTPELKALILGVLG